MAPPPCVEDVALIAERQPARAEPERELAQPARRPGVPRREVEMNRCLLDAAGPRGVHPHRPRVGHVTRVQVERGPIRHHLGSRDGRNHEPQERPPAHPPRARTSFRDRRSVHYGRAETAVWATWTTGTETPCTGRRTVSAAESRTSPAMSRPSAPKQPVPVAVPSPHTV